MIVVLKNGAGYVGNILQDFIVTEVMTNGYGTLAQNLIGRDISFGTTRDGHSYSKPRPDIPSLEPKLYQHRLDKC